MPIHFPIAHDFSCGWCWIGLHQTKRLRSEYGVTFEWRGYELFPEGMEIPPPSPIRPPENPNKPVTPSRMMLAYAAAGIPKPTGRPPWDLRTHNAHEVVELGKLTGVQDELVERLYRATWERSVDISKIENLVELAAGLLCEDEVRAVVEERRFAANIVAYDEPAYATGVYNLPNFWIGGERYAEQTYDALSAAIRAEGLVAEPVGVYAALTFPAPPTDRPYVMINMVATIDGKIITGERDEPVMDLGSKTDHATMRQIQGAADAVMIGAGALRSTPKIWYPAHLTRIVVTKSGNVDLNSRFFTDVPEKAIIATIQSASLDPAADRFALRVGKDNVDLRSLCQELKKRGIHRLLVEGGSDLNAQILEQDLVDELFLTIAPKIKLGKDTPTYADGNPLPRDQVQNYDLIQQTQVGNEIYLRYRRKVQA